MIVLIFFCGGFVAGWWWDEGSCRLICTRRYNVSDSTQPIVDNVITRTIYCLHPGTTVPGLPPHPTMRFFVHSITNERRNIFKSSEMRNTKKNISNTFSTH
jgi:hypothetical protein